MHKNGKLIAICAAIALTLGTIVSVASAQSIPVISPWTYFGGGLSGTRPLRTTTQVLVGASATTTASLLETPSLTITGLKSQGCIGTDGSGVVQAGTCSGGGGGGSGGWTAIRGGIYNSTTSPPDQVLIDETSTTSNAKLEVNGSANIKGGASSTAFTNSGTTWLTALTGKLLGTDGTGQVVGTTSVGTNYLTGLLATINGTAVTVGSSPTITAASSTALGDRNTWSALQALAAASTTNLTASNYWQIGQSAGCAQFDSNAKLTSTGVNCGTGSSGGDPFTHVSVYGQTTSASSTLFALTGSPFSLVASSTVAFVNASTTNATIWTNLYLPNVGNWKYLATNGSGAIVATTSSPGGGGGGSGTVNSGLLSQVAFYAADGTAVSGTSSLTISPNFIDLYPFARTFTGVNVYAPDENTVGFYSSSNGVSSFNLNAQTNNAFFEFIDGNSKWHTFINGDSYLNDTGRFAFGTSSPYSKLTVWGNPTGNIFEAVTNGSTTAAYINSSGLFTITNASTTNLTIGQSLFGANLSNCTGTSFLQWTSSNGKFGCGTPSAGSGVWPFTTSDTNYGVSVQSTTTPEWFKIPTSGIFSLMASSTAAFVNSSTTNATVFSNFYLPYIGAYQLLETDGNKNVTATTSIGNNLLQTSGVTGGSYTNANITVNDRGIVTSAANGTAGAGGGGDPFYHPTAISSATTTPVFFFGNASSTEFEATSTVWLDNTKNGLLSTDVNGKVGLTASSTIFGTGTGGQILSWANGVPSWIASTTYTGTSPISLSFLNGQVTGSCSTCVTTARNINTTFPLQGGGALSGDLTLTTAFGTTTNTGLTANQYVYTSPSGILVTAASSSETCSTPLSCGSHGVLSGGGAITIQAGGTSQNGYISSTDWNVFNGKLNFSNLFNIATTYGTTSLATTTAFWFQGGLNASSTASNPSHLDNIVATNATTTAATTTNMAISSVVSAMLLTNSSGSVIPFGGSSCSGQFPRSVSALGAWTCAKVDLAADVTGILPIANGGTATSTQVTNGVNYYDGAKITSSAALLSFTGTNLGIATSSPYLTFSVFGRAIIQGTSAATSSVAVTSSDATKGGKVIVQDMTGGTCTEIHTQGGVITGAVVTCP